MTTTRVPTTTTKKNNNDDDDLAEPCPVTTQNERQSTVVRLGEEEEPFEIYEQSTTIAPTRQQQQQQPSTESTSLSPTRLLNVSIPPPQLFSKVLTKFRNNNNERNASSESKDHHQRVPAVVVAADNDNNNERLLSLPTTTITSTSPTLPSDPSPIVLDEAAATNMVLGRLLGELQQARLDIQTLQQRVLLQEVGPSSSISPASSSSSIIPSSSTHVVLERRVNELVQELSSTRQDLAKVKEQQQQLLLTTTTTTKAEKHDTESSNEPVIAATATAVAVACLTETPSANKELVDDGGKANVVKKKDLPTDAVATDPIAVIVQTASSEDDSEIVVVDPNDLIFMTDSETEANSDSSSDSSDPSALAKTGQLSWTSLHASFRESQDDTTAIRNSGTNDGQRIGAGSISKLRLVYKNVIGSASKASSSRSSSSTLIKATTTGRVANDETNTVSQAISASRPEFVFDESELIQIPDSSSEEDSLANDESLPSQDDEQHWNDEAENSSYNDAAQLVASSEPRRSDVETSVPDTMDHDSMPFDLIGLKVDSSAAGCESDRSEHSFSNASSILPGSKSSASRHSPSVRGVENYDSDGDSVGRAESSRRSGYSQRSVSSHSGSRSRSFDSRQNSHSDASYVNSTGRSENHGNASQGDESQYTGSSVVSYDSVSRSASRASYDDDNDERVGHEHSEYDESADSHSRSGSFQSGSRIDDSRQESSHFEGDFGYEESYHSGGSASASRGAGDSQYSGSNVDSNGRSYQTDGSSYSATDGDLRQYDAQSVTTYNVADETEFLHSSDGESEFVSSHGNSSSQYSGSYLDDDNEDDDDEDDQDSDDDSYESDGSRNGGSSDGQSLTNYNVAGQLDDLNSSDYESEADSSSSSSTETISPDISRVSKIEEGDEEEEEEEEEKEEEEEEDHDASYAESDESTRGRGEARSVTTYNVADESENLDNTKNYNEFGSSPGNSSSRSFQSSSSNVGDDDDDGEEISNQQSSASFHSEESNRSSTGSNPSEDANQLLSNPSDVDESRRSYANRVDVVKQRATSSLSLRDKDTCFENLGRVTFIDKENTIDDDDDDHGDAANARIALDDNGAGPSNTHRTMSSSGESSKGRSSSGVSYSESDDNDDVPMIQNKMSSARKVTSQSDSDDRGSASGSYYSSEQDDEGNERCYEEDGSSNNNNISENASYSDDGSGHSYSEEFEERSASEQSMEEEWEEVEESYEEEMEESYEEEDVSHAESSESGQRQKHDNHDDSSSSSSASSTEENIPSKKTASYTEEEDAQVFTIDPKPRVARNRSDSSGSSSASSGSSHSSKHDSQQQENTHYDGSGQQEQSFTSGEGDKIANDRESSENVDDSSDGHEEVHIASAEKSSESEPDAEEKDDSRNQSESYSSKEVDLVPSNDQDSEENGGSVLHSLDGGVAEAVSERESSHMSDSAPSSPDDGESLSERYSGVGEDNEDYTGGSAVSDDEDHNAAGSHSSQIVGSNSHSDASEQYAAISGVESREVNANDDQGADQENNSDSKNMPSDFIELDDDDNDFVENYQLVRPVSHHKAPSADMVYDIIENTEERATAPFEAPTNRREVVEGQDDCSDQSSSGPVAPVTTVHKSGESSQSQNAQQITWLKHVQMSIKEEQAVLAFADGDDVPLDEAGIDAGAISSVPSNQPNPGKVHWPVTPVSKTTQQENPSDMSPQANDDIMKLLSDMLAYQRSAEHGGEIDPAEMASILVAIQRGVQQGSEDNEVDEDVDASYFDDDNETADDDDDYDANEEWDETHVETEDDGGTNSGSESADEPSSHVMKEDPDAPKPELIELFKTSGSDDSEHGRVEHPWISSELDDEARPITSADKKGEGDFHDIESGQDPEAEKWNDAYDRAPTSRGFRRYEIVGLAVCGVVLFLVIVLSIVLTRSDVVTPTTPSSMPSFTPSPTSFPPSMYTFSPALAVPSQPSSTPAPIDAPFNTSPTPLDDPWLLVGGPFAGPTDSDLGVSVSLSDKYMVAGAPSEQGSVQIYKYNIVQSNWQIMKVLSGESYGSLFGSSVSLTSTSSTLSGFVVGIPGMTGAASSSDDIFGAAAFYELNETNQEWTPIGSLIRGDENAYAVREAFGFSVAASTNRFVVACGAPFSNALNVQQRGRVYTYTWNGGINDWSPLSVFSVVGDSAGAFLGSSVDVSSDGSLLLAGGPGRNGGDGYAVVYSFDSSRWEPVAVLEASTSLEAFGSSVSIIDDKLGQVIAVGGPAYDSGRGVIRVYTRQSDGSYRQLGEDIVGQDTNDALGTAGTLSGSVIVNGDASSKSIFILAATANGSVRRFEWISSKWEQTLPSFGVGFELVRSLSMGPSANTFVVGGVNEVSVYEENV